MIKTRFAPSPTGMLHIGNARTALVTWLFARANEGHFMLRIDDTDTERSKKEYETAIEDSLKWLGMSWDSKANQIDRTDLYAEKIQMLKDNGTLYPCYETAEELSLKRKAQLSRGKPPIYDRAALSLSSEKIKAYENEGRTPHWRFKMIHEPIVWNDLVRGEVSFQGADLSDPVVIREDGSPLYHLCSVIDDIDFGMTHITRGEDHVSNTACHIQMFKALGATPPEFAHLPLLSAADGEKLSKRLGAQSIIDLRDDEKLEPMAVNSLLARIGTSEPIEAFASLAPLTQTFDFTKFSRGTPKLDPDDLIRLNAKILHDMPFADAKDRLNQMGFDQIDEIFWNTVKPNLERITDIQPFYDMVHGVVTPVIEDADYIKAARDALPHDPWNKETWGAWTSAIKEQTGRKGKELFMPLRQALTGQSRGPEMPELLILIGRDKVLERLAS